MSLPTRTSSEDGVHKTSTKLPPKSPNKSDNIDSNESIWLSEFSDNSEDESVSKCHMDIPDKLDDNEIQSGNQTEMGNVEDDAEDRDLVSKESVKRKVCDHGSSSEADESAGSSPERPKRKKLYRKRLSTPRNDIEVQRSKSCEKIRSSSPIESSRSRSRSPIGRTKWRSESPLDNSRSASKSVTDSLRSRSLSPTDISRCPSKSPIERSSSLLDSVSKEEGSKSNAVVYGYEILLKKIHTF